MGFYKYIKDNLGDSIREALNPKCAQCGKPLDQEVDQITFDEDDNLVINQAVYSCPNCYKEK